MNLETINKWLDEEYGCSFTRLEELHDFYFEKYCDLQKENKQLKELIDTILNLPFFKNECPLSICFENCSKEERSQNIFYKDDYCENNCNDNYKDCWLKYFKELQKNK